MLPDLAQLPSQTGKHLAAKKIDDPEPPNVDCLRVMPAAGTKCPHTGDCGTSDKDRFIA